MAKKIIASIVCDIDGTPGAEPIPFALDGVHYRIDLSEKRASDLREYLSTYIAKAQRIGGRKIDSGARPALSVTQRPVYLEKLVNPEIPDIRAWAAQNGYKIGTRGRISETIRFEYEQAKREPAKTALARKPSRRKVPAK
ncbi:Lsr2 family protein [Amycolatopsis sp. NPDC051071]|uniref:histone-like nucleoid-structuring protein Lsr2 n=1 Tax=Amycolatopsis sp. NPDC051071 TaxID=3154637 RepID=UPI003438D3FA